MKQIIFLAIVFLLIMGCKNASNEDQKKPPVVTDDMMETAIIYEANIRQYSPEGTFDAFTKDIPQLKQLGVKVIWLMPIFPISITNRKAKGDLFIHDIEDPEERKKYLGSYYAVSDFKATNPEFGTIEDFRNLVKTAHDNDIFVILDWVPNHTGWDHYWIKDRPDFYTKNAAGEITDPLNEEGVSIGWQDVADLNYDNLDLHEAMIADMKYWVDEEGVDGFRCDVAGSVPVEFWKKAIPRLETDRQLFMLAEAHEAELLKGTDLFDMCYGWDGHHQMNMMAKGEQDAAGFAKYLSDMSERYESDDILMNFITNHDENSWNGTVQERMGNAAEALLALSYITPGMPLIYSGQEYDLSHRLLFFEKDLIPKTKGKVWPILEKLAVLKTTHPALNGGKKAAAHEILDSGNPNVLFMRRQKDGDTIVFVMNVSKEVQPHNAIEAGNYKDAMSDKTYTSDGATKGNLPPWAYHIYLKN